MVTCQRCGVENTRDSNYCRRCGARLVAMAHSETPAGSGAADREDLDAQWPESDNASGTVLQIRSSGSREAEIVPVAGRLVTIGRSTQSDVFLDDVTVSRHHARIIVESAAHIIEDLSSLNGTYVNRKRIERHQLFDGDELQIGKYKLVFLQPKTDE